jgi:ketosteroid isomerase-like protein
MVEHRNVQRWKEMREGFFQGDVQPALDLLDPGVVWTNHEAAGPIAGAYRGVPAVLGMLRRGLEIFNGTLDQRVDETLASADSVVEIITERATVNGRSIDNRAVYVYRLADDRIVEVTTYERDNAAALRFWKAAGKVCAD